MSLVGVAGSLLCILKLGRSLGIVVSVREIVLTGPYRYVRHPIYLGYACLFGGVFLTACTVRMSVLVVVGAAMLCWRARLEEAVLAAHSPAYREWRERTGFLWPKRRRGYKAERWAGTPRRAEELQVAELARVGR